jgi:hypothetical protein
MAQKEGLLTPEQEQVVEDLSESDLVIMADAKRRLGASSLEIPNEAAAQADSA